MRHLLFSLFFVLPLVLAATGCGTGGDDDDSSDGGICASPCVITISGFTFTPDSVTIEEGTTVTFELSANHTALEVAENTWNDGATDPLDGGFSVAAGQTGSVVPSGLGTHWYVCEPHADIGMKGTIEVVAAAGGDDDDSGAGGDDDDSAAVVAVSDCTTYCAARVANCGDDATICAMSCGGTLAAGLPAGDVTDTSSNTLGCRIYHSGIAAIDATGGHCGHGNLVGGTTADGHPCSTVQELFCGLAISNCTGSDELYSNFPTCLGAVATVPSVSESPWPTGGDSIQCRTYHAEFAGATFSAAPETHCPHAGGAGPCS